MSVAFAGFGLWTALGRGLDVHREALRAGRSAQAPAPSLTPDEAGPPPWAALIDRQDLALPPGAVDLAALGLAAARDALADAGPAAPGARLGLIFGCATGALTRRMEAHLLGTAEARAVFAESLATSVADAVARGLALEGPRLVVSTACTSSLQAIVLGRALLEAGLLDRVLAGGAELVAPVTFAGFRRLGATSPGPCCPFSSPRGMALGEGAGFVVLERGEDLAARGRAARGWLRGAGGSSETWHATAPHPRGLGMIAAMRHALRDAGISATEVGYLDAQGTGTDANDLAEALAIGAVFGPVPVGATKSMVGHTLGAAGAIETILAMLALEQGALPPIAGFTEPRRIAPANLLAGPGCRPTTARIAVKNTAAFGGLNATLVLGTEPGARQPPAAEPVCVRASLMLGPAGIGLPLAPITGAIAPEILADLADARTLARDRVAGVLGAAVGLALRRAGESPDRPPGARVGLLCAVSPWPSSAGVAYIREIQRSDGPVGGARDFSATVRNAPAGSAAREHGLEGPGLTLVCAAGGGVAALVSAALLLRDAPSLEALVVAGVDERVPEQRRWTREPDAGQTEAAAAAVLGRARGEAEPRILGLGLGGASREGLKVALGAALPPDAPRPDLVLVEGGLPILSDALDEAGLGQIPRIELTRRLGRLEGCAGPAALAVAVEALAAGLSRVLLVGASEVAGASTVLLAGATSA